jgi:hypothetical protein
MPEHEVLLAEQAARQKNSEVLRHKQGEARRKAMSFSLGGKEGPNLWLVFWRAF